MQLKAGISNVGQPSSLPGVVVILKTKENFPLFPGQAGSAALLLTDKSLLGFEHVKHANRQGNKKQDGN